MFEENKKQMFFKKIKTPLLVFLSLCFTIILFYFFQERKIKIVKEMIQTDFSKAALPYTPIKSEYFLINYRKKNFNLYRYTFSDNETLENSLKLFPLTTNIVNQEEFNFNEYTGFLYQTKVDTSEVYSVFLRKENLVIIGIGENEKNLIKVIKWFLVVKK